MKLKAACGIVVLVVLILVGSTARVHADASGIEQARAHKIVAVWNFADPSEMTDAYALGLDVIEFAHGRWVKFVTDAESLADLRARGFAIEVENPDIIEYYSSRLLPTTMGGYRTLSEIVLAMDSLHDMNPAISTARFSIGQTLEGREIWVMKISDNPETDEDEPESFFIAATHAREVITPEITLEAMRTLIQGYGVDTFLTRLVDTREVYFMPCFNADGYEYNELIAPGGGGMWRKNRRNNGDGTFGVDLNRNYPNQWGYDDIGSSPESSSETYRGSAAASEPEIQVMMSFVESRNFTITVNIHSYSNLILWPYSYDYDLYSPDEGIFRAMGDSMSVFNGYYPTVGWVLYPVNGDADDWFYGEQTTKDKIYSFTFEVGSSIDGFWPATSRISQLVSENIQPIQYLIDVSANPVAAAPPLAPTWTIADTFPGGFFEIDWSQPDNGNQTASFDLYNLLGYHTMTDDAEDGTDRWIMDGFARHDGIKYEGDYSFFSGSANNIQHTMTSLYPLAVADGDTLSFYAWYDIETNWDYAYVEVSTESQSGFIPILGSITTNYNPYGNNRGYGITGEAGWTPATFDLSDFAGQEIYIRFSYHTDRSALGIGFFADVITPVTWFDQTVPLAEDYLDSTFSLTGQAMGDYYFSVNCTDTEGQTGPNSKLKKVHVAADVIYGDLNNDLAVNPVDVVWLVNIVYRNGPPPVLPGTQYINGDSACNPVDVVWLVNHVYRNGPPPLGYGEQPVEKRTSRTASNGAVFLSEYREV